MLTLNSGQSALIAEAGFVTKLDGKFCKQLPEFARLDQQQRGLFLVAGFRKAQSLGFISELGCAAYILSAWWLGLGFEQHCENVQRLLASEFPEIRKVYALNEYTHVLLGEPKRPDLADQALKQSFYRSAMFKG